MGDDPEIHMSSLLDCSAVCMCGVLPDGLVLKPHTASGRVSLRLHAYKEIVYLTITDECVRSLSSAWLRFRLTYDVSRSRISNVVLHVMTTLQGATFKPTLETGAILHIDNLFITISSY